MFLTLKALLISIWFIISLSSNVISTKHSKTDDDLIFLPAESVRKELADIHDSNTEIPCFIDYYEKKQEAGQCVNLSRDVRGCVSQSYIKMYHPNSNITSVLYEDIKFLSNRLEQINVDAIFGLSLAEAHLSAALSSNNIKSLNVDQRHRLDQVLKLCKTSCIQGKKDFFSKHPSNKFMETILESANWIHPINWERHFSKARPREKIIIPEYEILSLIFYGTPQERESDYCLGMLVKNDCELLDTCTEVLLKKDGSRGYPLTHRLLIIQTVEALQCKRPSNVNFSTLIEEYCKQIFEDLIDLDVSNFPLISRDLAMEQITLCGMVGYLDFIDNYYINLVMSWRSPYGCFSAFKPNRRSRHRSKKSTNLMDHGCDSHASGVAAAALSLFIRAYIENYLSSNHE